MKTTIAFKRYVKRNNHLLSREIWFYSNRDICWRVNGLLHREGGPAVIWHTGQEYWFKYGKRDHHKEMKESWKHWNSKGNIEFVKRLSGTAFTLLFILAAIVVGFYLSFN